MKIAWTGCGVVGINMLLDLKKGGHTVSTYSRTYEKTAPLFKQGIRVECTIRDCASDADVVYIMVSCPKDVEEIYEGDDSILAHIKAYAILIDLITSPPALIKKLYTAAKAKGYTMLDAPISGGGSGARAASPSTMTSGDEEVFEQIRPPFSLLGMGIQYMEEAGSGQHTKVCNQIAVAGAVAVMSGALVYAKAAGLDKQKMLTAIAKGAAGSWQTDNTASHVLANDFVPGFYTRRFIEDMHIAQQGMEQQDVCLDMLEAVCNMYEALAGVGEENNGIQALMHYYK